MKLDFNYADDNKYHQYCINCHKETIERVYKGKLSFYFCNSCKQTNDRSIVIDPDIKWWVAKDNEYWHESGGVFIRNTKGKFLFFERLIFPFALTVPSGHVDTGEEALTALKRETKEEVGLDVSEDKLNLVATEDIARDSCRRGSDAHRWHAYLLKLDQDLNLEVTEKEEGEKPVWLSLSEALDKELTYPVRYIINKYQHVLID